MPVVHLFYQYDFITDWIRTAMLQVGHPVKIQFTFWTHTREVMGLVIVVSGSKDRRTITIGTCDVENYRPGDYTKSAQKIKDYFKRTFKMTTSDFHNPY